MGGSSWQKERLPAASCLLNKRGFHETDLSRYRLSLEGAGNRL